MPEIVINKIKNDWRQKNLNLSREYDRQYAHDRKNDADYKARRAAINKRYAAKKNKWIGLCKNCKAEFIKEKSNGFCSDTCRQETIQKRREDYRKKNVLKNRENAKQYWHKIKKYKLRKEKRCFCCDSAYYGKGITCKKEQCKKQLKKTVRAYHKQKRRAKIKGLEKSFVKKDWINALKYFGHLCAYCGAEEKHLHQEHIIPLSKGGPYASKNIVPACCKCNSSKGVEDFEKWYGEQIFYSWEKHIKILLFLATRE